jgi:hypothetical protein
MLLGDRDPLLCRLRQPARLRNVEPPVTQRAERQVARSVPAAVRADAVVEPLVRVSVVVGPMPGRMTTDTTAIAGRRPPQSPHPRVDGAIGKVVEHPIRYELHSTILPLRVTLLSVAAPYIEDLRAMASELDRIAGLELVEQVRALGPLVNRTQGSLSARLNRARRAAANAAVDAVGGRYELAKRLGISEQALSRLLSGARSTQPRH